MKKVSIYTDGSCLGNPGVGGYAAILTCEGREKVITGGTKKSTNNRMEMTAVIEALGLLKKACAVTIYTDSSYLVNNFSRMPEWRANGWMGASGAVKNHELWDKMDFIVQKLTEMGATIEFSKVRGHAGVALNERCDRLARGIARQLAYEILMG